MINWILFISVVWIVIYAALAQQGYDYQQPPNTDTLNLNGNYQKNTQNNHFIQELPSNAKNHILQMSSQFYEQPKIPTLNKNLQTHSNRYNQNMGTVPRDSFQNFENTNVEDKLNHKSENERRENYFIDHRQQNFQYQMNLRKPSQTYLPQIPIKNYEDLKVNQNLNNLPRAYNGFQEDRNRDQNNFYNFNDMTKQSKNEESYNKNNNLNNNKASQHVQMNFEREISDVMPPQFDAQSFNRDRQLTQPDHTIYSNGDNLNLRHFKNKFDQPQQDSIQKVYGQPKLTNRNKDSSENFFNRRNEDNDGSSFKQQSKVEQKTNSFKNAQQQIAITRNQSPQLNEQSTFSPRNRNQFLDGIENQNFESNSQVKSKMGQRNGFKNTLNGVQNKEDGNFDTFKNTEGFSRNFKADEENNQNDSDYSAIPGIPENDYPMYSEIPKTSFDCKQQDYPGYYADIDTQCQVFHVCIDERTFNFLCPNGTVFHQKYLVCVWWYQFNCTNAPSLYGVNAMIYNYSKNQQLFANTNINSFDVKKMLNLTDRYTSPIMNKLNDDKSSPADNSNESKIIMDLLPKNAKSMSEIFSILNNQKKSYVQNTPLDSQLNKPKLDSNFQNTKKYQTFENLGTKNTNSFSSPDLIESYEKINDRANFPEKDEKAMLGTYSNFEDNLNKQVINNIDFPLKNKDDSLSEFVSNMFSGYNYFKPRVDTEKQVQLDQQSNVQPNTKNMFLNENDNHVKNNALFNRDNLNEKMLSQFGNTPEYNVYNNQNFVDNQEINKKTSQSFETSTAAFNNKPQTLEQLMNQMLKSKFYSQKLNHSLENMESSINLNDTEDNMQFYYNKPTLEAQDRISSYQNKLPSGLDYNDSNGPISNENRQTNFENKKSENVDSFNEGYFYEKPSSYFNSPREQENQFLHKDLDNTNIMYDANQQIKTNNSNGQFIENMTKQLQKFSTLISSKQAEETTSHYQQQKHPTSRALNYPETISNGLQHLPNQYLPPDNY